ncbi:MAG: sugar transporter [Pseudomonadota bacterium]
MDRKGDDANLFADERGGDDDPAGRFAADAGALAAALDQGGGGGGKAGGAAARRRPKRGAALRKRRVGGDGADARVAAAREDARAAKAEAREQAKEAKSRAKEAETEARRNAKLAQREAARAERYGAPPGGALAAAAPGVPAGPFDDDEDIEDAIVAGESGPRAAIVLDMEDGDAAARIRRRAFWSRFWIWLSFIAMVAAPAGGATWYLYERAADQYASEVAFAVRSLEGGGASPVLDIFGAGSDSTAADSQMLFEFLQSQPLVEKVDARLDLRELYNRPEADRLFAMGEAGSVEELVEYWNRAIAVSYDAGSGIIHVGVKAFRPQDARAVATALLDESGSLINGLSTGARADAVRFAEVDLGQAEARVREARLALQDFRANQGTADVSGEIGQEMGLISGLRGQRAALQGEFDRRASSLREGHPLLRDLERQLASVDAQIEAAEARIAREGDGGATSERDLVDAAGEQERLQVELEFATNMYTAAQAALEGARAEARRAQRYLATHIEPTLSEEAAHPQRLMWSVSLFGLLLLGWSILLLIISSIRDRN